MTRLSSVQDYPMRPIDATSLLINSGAKVYKTRGKYVRYDLSPSYISSEKRSMTEAVASKKTRCCSGLEAITLVRVSPVDSTNTMSPTYCMSGRSVMGSGVCSD
ncbi:hypothetical protein RRG08_061110 [Elysia crispata]|uniref:Uncharacterized protein n=1 Tax=Elysia crispata TaxID=231223 RepID=A0AAE0ZWR9_9GAST|nr:hypothetical protein RRG08_061110 [Elysia crispata]